MNPSLDEVTWSDLSVAAVRAYKRVLRLIHQRGLKPMDRLPVQQELRQELKLTNDSLTRAMRLLVDQGVVRRMSKAGTQLLDMNRATGVPWSVGMANIAAPSSGPSSVFTTLSHYLHVCFARQGWLTQTYYRFGGPGRHPRLADFGDLDQHLENGAIDGLVMLTTAKPDEWTGLNDRGVPVCHAPFWEQAPAGVVVDQAAMVRQAVALLAGSGCKRFMVVVESDVFFHRYREGLTAGLADAGLSTEAGRWITCGPSIVGGAAAGRRLLEMPADERPDALIVLDDYQALGLTEVLYTNSNGGNVSNRRFHPRIVVQANRELPLHYHLPVVRYEVSIEDIAQRTTQQMHKRLLNPATKPGLEFVKPVLVDRDHLAFSAGASVAAAAPSTQVSIGQVGA